MTPQPLTGRMARAMQIVWLVELGGFAIAATLMQRHGLGAGDIAWRLAAWFFGFRAFIVLDGFRNSETRKFKRAPDQQIGFVAALRLFAAEYLATIASFNLMYPLERWLLPQGPQVAIAGKGVPVVLVHGFICNRGYWRPLTRALQTAGLGPVYAVTLEPVWGSIDDNARRLGEIVEQICKDTGAQKVALVGHSMGGLVIRAYAHAGGAHRIARAVTLGTPHHGTWAAHALRKWAVNADQMAMTRNDWLAALNAHEAKSFPAPITSVWTPHDNIAFPQNGAELKYPNARNVCLTGLGHVELVFSPTAMKAVIAALA